MRPSARRSSSTSPGSRVETTWRPSDQTTPPITAASRRSSFSACGRRSTRAVTIPRTVSGSPARSPPEVRMRTSSSAYNGLPAASSDDVRPEVGIGRVPPEQRLDEPLDVSLRQRPERHGERVALPAAPVRAALEQLRSCAADDEERYAFDEVDESVHELEQAVVRPLEVVDHEDERPLLRERLEEDAPPGLKLRAAVGERDVLRDEPDERAQARLDPASVAFVDDVGDASGRASPRRARRCRSRGCPPAP